MEKKNPAENKPQKKNKKLIWFGVLAVLFFAGITAFFYFGVDLKPVHERIATFNGVVVFLCMVILPLVGFPVSLIYLIAGSKFGSVWGFVLCAIAIAVHLVATYWLAKYLRGPLTKLLNKLGHKLPQVPKGEEVYVTLLTALIPGLPYAARNYVLALTGVPLKTYFWVCWPVFVIRSSLAIFLGDMTKDLTPGRITFLVCYLSIKIGICAYILHRLRRRSKAMKEKQKTSADTAAHDPS